jgi:DNA-binding GntR family transcriptional regulator
LAIQEIERASTVDKVVAMLRQAILEGELPPGEALREVSLSLRVGVARSTIREALRVLATDGLVARRPHRGLEVRHLTRAEVEDIFAARRVLEREAARAAAVCAEAQLGTLLGWFQAYQEAASRSDVSSAARAHVEFHTAMVGLTGSRRLAETERSLMRDLQVVISSIDKDSDDLPKEIEKHRVLAALFRERDVAGATRQLEADLDHAMAFVFRHAADG